jgi:hypothetical protein
MGPSQVQTVRPDVVLHIGSGKTGTTSIQNFLHQNRRKLRRRAGLLVPKSPGVGRHIRLGLSIRSDEEMVKNVSYHRQGHDSPAALRESLHRALEQEINDAGLPRLLLSDEALYGASQDAVRRLHDYLGSIGGQLRVVVYLRRQDDHLASRYQQVVKVGETRRMADRVAEMDLSAPYDYHARLGIWRDHMAPDEMVVRPFQRDRFVDGDLMADFLDACAIDLPVTSLKSVRVHNESLDAETVEFLRILNLHLVDDQGVERSRISHQKIVRRLIDGATGPTLTLPDDQLDEWMAQWEGTNRAVARDYLGAEELFTAPRRDRSSTTEQRLDPDRLPHFLELAQVPKEHHAALRRIADREAT